MTTSVSLNKYSQLVLLAVQQHQALLQDDLPAFNELMEQREAILAEAAAVDMDRSDIVRKSIIAYLEQLQILDDRMLKLLGGKHQEASLDMGALLRRKAVSGRYLVRQNPASTVQCSA